MRVLATLFAAAALASQAAFADSRLAAPANPKYQEECGSCHIAYQPGLLPATSWQRTMIGLASHFGTDASVDAATAAAIGRYLQDNAATGKRAVAGGTGLRISEAPWFVREHRQVDAATWKSPAVKSVANCTACHAGAAGGDYSERAVRIAR